MAKKSDVAKAQAEAARAEAEARSRAAEADAKARAAEAEARASEARARTEAAEAERRAKADVLAADEKVRAEKAEHERQLAPFKTGVAVAAPVVGIGVGAVLSKVIEARHAAALQAAAPELTKIAASVDKVTAKVGKGKVAATTIAKLEGALAAVDKLGLTRIKGPVGVPMAAALLAEAAYTRFGLAPTMEDGKAKAAVQAASTASVFVATTMVGERVMHNATLAHLPDVRAVASVERARAIVAAAKPATAIAGVTSKALAVAGKVALPLAAVGAVVEAVKGGVAAHDKGGGALDVAAGAALGALDSLSFGLASKAAHAAGELMRGASGAGATSAPEAPNKRVSDASGAAGSNAATVAAARVALGAEAAHRAAGAVAAAANHQPVVGPQASAEAVSDGMTKGYTRNFHGQLVQVQGYKTPTRKAA